MLYKKTPLIGGKTICQWNAEWKTLKGGFLFPQREVRNQVGLFCAQLNGQIMYIGCSSAWCYGKLAERIASFGRKLQSQNDHHGAWMIKQHLKDLSLQVIPLGTSPRYCNFIVALSNAMIRYHQPAWNVRKGGKK